MLLIGLWHGFTWNFVIWGLWHGLGMFVHNRWSDFLRTRLAGKAIAPRWQSWLNMGGTLLTFHYVTLGWIWFALPDPADSIRVFALLLGAS
jgi:alginate O-acetyltransferase complex protein AlgI